MAYEPPIDHAAAERLKRERLEALRRKLDHTPINWAEEIVEVPSEQAARAGVMAASEAEVADLKRAGSEAMTEAETRRILAANDPNGG